MIPTLLKQIGKDILDFEDTQISNTIETKIETEPRLWKVGRQVFGSVQRGCSWLVQCQQIHQQR